MRKITALVILITFLIFNSLSSFAFTERLDDDADLLDSNEESEISTLLENAYSELNFDIVIVTTYDTDGKSVMEFADDYYDTNAFGEDGLLFLIDMGGREWWISTSGEAINKFSDSVLDYIGAESASYLSEGQYIEAFKTFISLSEIYIKSEGDYNYDDNYNDGFYDDTYYDDIYEEPVEFDFFSTLVISLVAGFIIALVIVSSMKGKLTSVGVRNEASNYVLNNSLQIASSGDNFLYKNISRVPRPKSNSSGDYGGGRSVHRSSSGRSHGGRGGRF